MTYAKDYETAIKYSSNSEYTALLKAIDANPTDRLGYGVLADWLEERGHDALGGFIREHGMHPEHEPVVYTETLGYDGSPIYHATRLNGEDNNSTNLAHINRIDQRTKGLDTVGKPIIFMTGKAYLPVSQISHLYLNYAEHPQHDEIRQSLDQLSE